MDGGGAGPLRKMPRQTKTRLLRCRRRGFENNDAEVTPGLLGKDEKKEIDEEQGERSERLLGDRHAEKSPHGGRVRDHPLVREEVQRRLQSARGLENLTSCVSQDVRFQIRERSTRIPCDRFDECTFQGGIPRFWWTCCTRRRNGLSGVTCTWEPRGRSLCEHMQALMTNVLQRHWEWQEDRRTGQGPGLFQAQNGFSWQAWTWPKLPCHRRFYL